jgi:LPPG:FO 2-phospho-L-lactate transferase
MRVALLAGGTGAARLARGLAAVLPAGALSVITNTADDEELWGLRISPDTDSVLYRLAGLFNESSGFGVRDETFHTLEMLGRLGEPTWFGLGDRDIGLHLLRESLRRGGATFTEAVAEVVRRLGLPAAVIPMSDDRVRTRVLSEAGELSFQEWYVRDGCRPAVRGLRFDGAEAARASDAAVEAVGRADLVLIGPSNPLLSIDPILGVLGPHLDREQVVAVSPVVGGRALKGPTVSLLAQLGEEPSALGVARRYARVAAVYVLDRADAGLAGDVAALGLVPQVLDTVMEGGEGERRLARELLALPRPPPSRLREAASPSGARAPRGPGGRSRAGRRRGRASPRAAPEDG